MSTGYYREDMVPPEHRGKVWPHRAVERGSDGEQIERMVQSPFPPVAIGNPAEQVAAFRDFQNWRGRNARAERPDDYCEDCGIRYAVVVCKGKEGCGSARVEYPNVDRILYHCLNCDRRFSADRFCGPCIGERQARSKMGKGAAAQLLADDRARGLGLAS